MTKHRLKKVLIAGGGIGGLAAALACARQGLPTQLWERAAQLSEVGAGIQLGPNVTRILQAWGLSDALNQVAAFPESLQARDARTGEVLGVLRLGARAQNRYGAPYVTLHRADLQGLLHESAQAHGVDIRLGQTLQSWQALADGLEVGSVAGDNTKADALIGADGVWSAVRQQWRGDGPAQFTGHVAYRALLPQADLPLHLRSQEVTVWMGPRLHVVHYPVRGGEALNMVAIVQAERPTHSQEWDAAGHAQALLQAMGADVRIVQHGDGIDNVYVSQMSEEQTRAAAASSRAIDRRIISICHSEPGAWSAPSPRFHTSRCPHPQADIAIGRTMFETDRLPQGWAQRLLHMHRVRIASPLKHRPLIGLIR
jgi:salicylate hydroxylase